MKLGITIVLLSIASFANSQSLKDMLYKGKLKKDSTSVIRKTDDLSTKMVDTTKKADIVQVDTIAVIWDSTQVKTTAPARKVEMTDSTGKIENAEAVDSAVTISEPIPAPVAPPVKSNNKIWKEFTDSLVTEMKTEVLSSKKVKKETYYLTVEYELGLEGEVSILNVFASPENDFLANQVKDRLISSSPVLAPVVDSSGKARKVKRKYNFTITKD